MAHIEKHKKYRFDVEYKNFKSGVVRKFNDEIEFTGVDLARAILTCGVIKASFSDYIFKWQAIEYQFDEKSGKIYSSDDYNYMDPSEKVCLSFYRGMIFGRLISIKVFSIDYFIHYKSFIKCNKITKTGSGEPDIIGYNNSFSDFYVWECKGDRGGMKKGEDQLKTVSAINGVKPKMKLVSAAYFTPKLHKLKACVKDPDSNGENIPLDINSALDFYYRPIVHIIFDSFYEEENEIIFTYIWMLGEYYKLGIPKIIFNYYVQNRKDGDFKSIIKECSEMQLNRMDNINKDFIYIE